MNCLCCGKPIKDNNESTGWHKTCIKKFFTTTVIPEDKEEFALPINGKKRNIHRKDFLIFASSCGIAKLAAEKMIGQLVSMKPVFIDMCRNSLMLQDMKEAFIELVDKRVSALR